MASGHAPSIPMFFKGRNTHTDPWAIPTPRYGGLVSIIFWRVSPLWMLWDAGTSRLGLPMARIIRYLAQNIEQIVAWLLREEIMGGFHFNDRHYADDDLTLGSIDPNQIFRIF